MEIFTEGMKYLKADVNNGFFAWHGAPAEAITSICCEGWDTKRRSGQAYGRGEYFGVNP